MSACWRAFIAIAAVSGLINILYLTGSFYMLEVYDRVLPSRNIPTLVALSILALTLFTFQGILDVIRSRVMVRIAATLDERLSARIFDIMVRLPLKTRGQGDGLAPMRDLDQIRAFLVSTGPSALFDLPWMPFYLLICFVFHFWIGVAALIGALDPHQPHAGVGIHDTRPCAHGQHACGHPQQPHEGRAPQCRGAAGDGHGATDGQDLGRGQPPNTSPTSDKPRTLPAAWALLSKVLRFTLQSGVLGLGAYLVIQRTGDGRYHHREFDPGSARAGAGGTGDRQLEGLCLGAPELAAPVRPTARARSRHRADETARPRGEASSSRTYPPVRPACRRSWCRMSPSA